MSQVKVFSDQDPNRVLWESDQGDEMAERLGSAGVTFERWQASQDVSPGDPEADILAAYQEDIDRLVDSAGYKTFDVVSLSRDHPQKDEMRQKFLAEHTHGEDEVRFFVAGHGLFTLHIEDRVYEVLCEQGDLISVPANTKHWFDMGPNPNFVAIRLFNNPEGWVANFTGSDIAERFSRLEN